MPPLLQKSDENISASKFLLESHSLYNASVHGAYYSSLQRSMYLLQEYFTNSSTGQINEDGNSHNRTINALEQNLREKGYIRDAFEFNQKISKLKRSRVKSDYRNTLFTKNQSADHLSLAQDLNQMIDRIDKSLSSSK